MRALAVRDEHRIADIAAALDTLQISGPSAIPTALTALRELAEAESAAVYSIGRCLTGWELERWNVDGALADPRVLPRVDALFATEATDALFYDPLLPAPEICDRVFEAGAWLDERSPGTWKASRMYREVFAPLRMFEHKQLRALVCEGPVLLGWFGLLHPDETTPRQAQILSALVPAMRRRLAVERRLASGLHHARALEVALTQLGAAAFVVSATGVIHEANAQGRALLASHRREIATAIADALAGTANAIAIELTPIAETGVGARWLAIVRDAPSELRIAAAVARWATVWNLTPRQRQVLEILAHGQPNATIAALLTVAVRTVELHVTALLARADVESRSALLARVLAG